MTSASAQENGFKVYSRWYRTPDRLHKIYPEVSPTCWRCNSQIGSLLHVWWNCPRMQPFWKEIHRITSHITTYSLEYSPARYLLHHTAIPQSTYKRSLALHLINATKMCISVHWRENDPLTIKDWLQRTKKIAEMEDLSTRPKKPLINSAKSGLAGKT